MARQDYVRIWKSSTSSQGNETLQPFSARLKWNQMATVRTNKTISQDKARKGVIYPLKTGIYALVGISERPYTR